MRDEKEYSNRELDLKFNDLHEKLDKIIDQTTKTNGSVRALQLWRAAIVGGLMVLAATNASNFVMVAQALAGVVK